MVDSQSLSASLEDYLEAILQIVRKKKAAKAKDIAKRLKVNSSSVTGALQALARKGLVNYAPYDLITLTPAGDKIAQDVIRRHNALKKFFIEVLSIEEKEAEETACKVEHDVSPDIIKRLVEFVKFMEKCPFGGATWNSEDGFICHQAEKLESCNQCEAEFHANQS